MTYSAAMEAFLHDICGSWKRELLAIDSVDSEALKLASAALKLCQQSREYLLKKSVGYAAPRVGECAFIGQLFSLKTLE